MPFEHRLSEEREIREGLEDYFHVETPLFEDQTENVTRIGKEILSFFRGLNKNPYKHENNAYHFQHIIETFEDNGELIERRDLRGRVPHIPSTLQHGLWVYSVPS